MSSNFFSSLTQGVSKFTSTTITEATKAKEKFFEGQTQAEQTAFSSLWELPEPVEYCRECNVKFQLIKHHCRSCAGVFCDDCCPSVIPSLFERKCLIPSALPLSSTESVRLCLACKRGDCPSKSIKDKIRVLLDEELLKAGKPSGKIEKFFAKIDAKLEEAANKIPIGDNSDSLASKVVSVKRGSYYGENHMMKKSGSKPMAVSGYFELFNKSHEVIAIKLMRLGENTTKFEIPRPRYIAIPPNEAVYAFFDSEKVRLELVLLHANPNPLPTDTSISCDTQAHGVNPSRISPCARIDLFEKVQVYNIESIGHNVLLKYKGEGVVLPREGSSMERVGIFSYFQGRRFKEGMLDYQTNVSTLQVGFHLR